jgi:hypothetical protein
MYKLNLFGIALCKAQSLIQHMPGIHNEFSPTREQSLKNRVLPGNVDWMKVI